MDTIILFTSWPEIKLNMAGAKHGNPEPPFIRDLFEIPRLEKREDYRCIELTKHGPLILALTTTLSEN